MEVMEDGNLMDKVHILIQRDMEYYKEKQSVLQQTICPGIVGGRLDFPRSASFASIKLVLWWEDEYYAAFRRNSGFVQKINNINIEQQDGNSGNCGGIVKTSDPTKFLILINKSAEQLLEHLHMLTQEALDHADLTVLTGTIGAAALLKNCLWFYMQTINNLNQIELLQNSYKKYQQMCEALAERLLDLHCRLLSLYILQEPESMDWENPNVFNESERGSYIIQMWWLYMQGTRDDLWDTVPPKMAQRVFAGMLNESLTILTVRYTQLCPSIGRAKLLIVDISNLLLCVTQLLPSICDKAEDLLGLTLNQKNKILRDIHSKCQELLNCLLLRGTPLDILHKIFRRGIENVAILKSKNPGPSPWIIFTMCHMFNNISNSTTKMLDLPENVAIVLELFVLLGQPQPNWALLVKILAMRNCKILRLILNISLEKFNIEMQKPQDKSTSCQQFLCANDNSCENINTSTTLILNQSNYYNLIMSTISILINIGNSEDFNEIVLGLITKQTNWSKCLDRRNVWNQIRPPWYEAILNLIEPFLADITKTVINAFQTGASMYQTMLIVLACFSQLWDCIEIILAKLSNLLQDLLPADTVPLNNSVLIQILISALYTELLILSQNNQKIVRFNNQIDVGCNRDKNKSQCSIDSCTSTSQESIALAIAESLCSIDEDNKHTDQIEEFLEQVKDNLEKFNDSSLSASRIESNESIIEILTSDLLMNKHSKRNLKILYQFIKANHDWLLQQLEINKSDEILVPNRTTPIPIRLLHIMFHIGDQRFDQLLTNEWQPNWFNLLQTPMGLSVDRVWSQIALRWEFRDVNSPSLSARDSQIIANLTAILKQN